MDSVGIEHARIHLLHVLRENQQFDHRGRDEALVPVDGKTAVLPEGDDGHRNGFDVGNDQCANLAFRLLHLRRHRGRRADDIARPLHLHRRFPYIQKRLIEDREAHADGKRGKHERYDHARNAARAPVASSHRVVSHDVNPDHAYQALVARRKVFPLGAIAGRVGKLKLRALGPAHGAIHAVFR